MGNETKKMKNIIILLSILFLSSWTTVQSDFHEYNLKEKTVIFISPDSTEIENLKTKQGDDFYTIADDVMYYRSNLIEVTDRMKIKTIFTDERFIHIITPTDSLEVNMNMSETKWHYIFYDGKSIVEADIFEIIDLVN